MGKHVVLQGNSTNPQRYDDRLDYAQQIASLSPRIRLNQKASYPLALHLIRIKLLSALNKPFAGWGELFPSATCVVSLVDRLVHKAEILTFEGESYRLKEARERSERKKQQRAARAGKAKAPVTATPG